MPFTELSYQGLDTGWNVHLPPPRAPPLPPQCFPPPPRPVGASLRSTGSLLVCKCDSARSLLTHSEQVTARILALTYEESRHQPSLTWPKTWAPSSALPLTSKELWPTLASALPILFMIKLLPKFYFSIKRKPERRAYYSFKPWLFLINFFKN